MEEPLVSVMDFIHEWQIYLGIIFQLIDSEIFFFTVILFVLIYHVLMYLFKDKKHLKEVKRLKISKKIGIDDLNYLPKISIIVPAWNEGKEFRECLQSIRNLKYPHINTIVNAGGSEETIEIANEFKQYDNFIILKQTKGKTRAAFGKIKAVNKCLNYISEGIIYLIDADCYLTDEILVRMIYPIVNKNENVVICSNRPLKSQEKIPLVNYLQLTRLGHFKRKITRYSKYIASGANTCIKYEAMKKIGKFNENKLIAEDISRGFDIISKGYSIYLLFDYRSRIYTDFPITIKEYIKQRVRYFQNSLLFAYKNRDLKYIVKFIIMIIWSFYLLLSLVFIFLNFGLIIISVALFLSLYLLKVRKFLFFWNEVKDEINYKFPKTLFIRTIFYIIIEIISNIVTLCSLINYRKSLKKT